MSKQDEIDYEMLLDKVIIYTILLKKRLEEKK